MSQFSFYVALVTSLLDPGDVPSRQHSIVDRPYARGLVQFYHSGNSNRLLDHAAEHMKAALVIEFLDCAGWHADRSRPGGAPQMQPANTPSVEAWRERKRERLLRLEHCSFLSRVGPGLHGRHMFP